MVVANMVISGLSIILSVTAIIISRQTEKMLKN